MLKVILAAMVSLGLSTFAFAQEPSTGAGAPAGNSATNTDKKMDKKMDKKHKHKKENKEKKAE